MTPRSAAERGPRTAAGRALLEIAGTEGQPTGVIRDAIVAIEAEATATSSAADAWQAGYEACWNRLRDAGRLLPSDGATAARREAALVDALRALLAACEPLFPDSNWTIGPGDGFTVALDKARSLLHDNAGGDDE